MKNKDWTREQVGRLTLNDLRILSHEHAPPEPGDTLGVGGKITNAADYEAVLEAQKREAESWAH